MLPKQEVTYAVFQSLALKATFYEALSNVKGKTILYFHGGGLVYGQRDDLPEAYIQSFLDSGYHFLTVDYPLAPETPLSEIYQAAKASVCWFIENHQQALRIEAADFILFGRSAGAYIALLLASDADLPKPEKIISFYGYYALTEPSFTTKSAYYQNFQSVPEVLVKKMIGTQPLVKGPLQTRYALYLYGRQSGKWLELLGVSPSEQRDFSLTEDTLAALPPTFIAHSQHDQDVPYAISQKLHQQIPHSVLYTATDLEHDFDREPTEPQAQAAYRQALDWLKN